MNGPNSETVNIFLKNSNPLGTQRVNNRNLGDVLPVLPSRPHKPQNVQSSDNTESGEQCRVLVNIS